MQKNSCIFLFSFLTTQIFFGKDYKIKSYYNSVYGEYTLYDYNAQVFPSFPDGVKPIYHIFIGRHGSRYIENTGAYTHIAKIFAEAESEKILTHKGKKFWKWYKTVYPEWAGHEQELTGIGRRQLAKHAENVYNWLPQLFDGPTKARVSTSPTLRVIQSEEAFVERMKQLDHDFSCTKDTVKALQSKPYAPVLNKFQNIYLTQRSKKIDTQAFAMTFFTDSTYIKRACKSEYSFAMWMRNIFSSIYGLDTKVPLGYKGIMSKKWHRRMLEAINLGTYLGLGRCPQINAYGVDAYKEALNYIFGTARKDMADRNDIKLNLNFTHDIVILNFLARLRAGTFGAVIHNLDNISDQWNCSYMPMSCNLQFCVCERQNDHVLLAYPLYNGLPISLPLKEVLSGAYLWEDIVNLL